MSKTLQALLTKRETLRRELSQVNGNISALLAVGAQCPHANLVHESYGFAWCADCNCSVRVFGSNGRRLPQPVLG